MERNIKAENKCKMFIEKGFKVDMETGKVYSNTGKEMTAKNPKGYIILGFRNDNKIINLRAHHFVYFVANGYVPNEIDHIDRNSSNNNINNLRSVTRRENILNKFICEKAKNYHKVYNTYVNTKTINGKIYIINRTKEKEISEEIGKQLRNINTEQEILEFKNKIECV
jgi:hypothetical protein